ncbi:MAG: pyridoxamine 5'-phosphate oxidase family protein [Candidatus Poribacteria bacterium]
MPKKWITDRSEIDVILNESQFGSFATVNLDNSPYVVPINYVYHNGKIYFHCALKGKKLDNIKHNPKACFSAYIVDRIVLTKKSDDTSVHYRSVIVNGKARLIDDLTTKMEVLKALTNKYNKNSEPPSFECASRVGIVEIEIEEITGKKNVD